MPQTHSPIRRKHREGEEEEGGDEEEEPERKRRRQMEDGETEEDDEEEEGTLLDGHHSSREKRRHGFGNGMGSFGDYSNLFLLILDSVFWAPVFVPALRRVLPPHPDPTPHPLVPRL